MPDGAVGVPAARARARRGVEARGRRVSIVPGGGIMGEAIGSWAEIVAAFAALAGAFVSVLALKTAMAARQTADRAREDANEFAADARDRETRRQDAEVAGQLQAWWVCWQEDEELCFGILVTNAGQGATVFRDVRIEASGNANARGSRGAIRFTALPPGAYVVQSTAAGSDKPWSEPQPARGDVTYEPLMKAQRYAVTSITFEDPTTRAWRWTPQAGLELRSEP